MEWNTPGFAAHAVIHYALIVRTIQLLTALGFLGRHYLVFRENTKRHYRDNTYDLAWYFDMWLNFTDSWVSLDSRQLVVLVSSRDREGSSSAECAVPPAAVWVNRQEKHLSVFLSHVKIPG